MKKNQNLSQEVIEKRYKDRNLEMIGEYKGCGVGVKTKCFCGSVFISKPDGIFQGKTRSCGCLKRGANSCHFKGHGTIPKTYISAVIRNAKTRKIACPLLESGKDGMVYLNQLLLDQNSKCALSGEDIYFHQDGDNNASLDRIDSSRGYEKGNVQWLHKNINVMKWDLSNEDFILWCKKVLNTNKRR